MVCVICLAHGVNLQTCRCRLFRSTIPTAKMRLMSCNMFNIIIINYFNYYYYYIYIYYYYFVYGYLLGPDLFVTKSRHLSEFSVFWFWFGLTIIWMNYFNRKNQINVFFILSWVTRFSCTNWWKRLIKRQISNVSSSYVTNE